MREDTGAVDAFPPHGGVGQLVVLVPRQFLGEKTRHSTLGGDLWQVCRVTEGVRQPEGAAAHPQFPLEVAGAEGELTDQGFPAGHVHVRFHPHAT